MKTIAITGASGFLGKRAVEYFKDKYNVVEVTRQILDLTDGEKIYQYFTDIKPNLVLHSAAIADTNEAQSNPELSNLVNKMAPYYIAKACKECGANLVYLSSDQVYSGNEERIPLKEDVKLNPVNLYAQQKLEAEKLIAEVLPSAVSLRLTWMYDSPELEPEKRMGLIKALVQADKNNTKIRVNSNQMRSVTYIRDVIENLEVCFSLPGGSYNFGSENDKPISEFYAETIKVLGLNESILDPFEGEYRNILIDTTKIKKYGIIFPTAIEGVQLSI